MAALPVLDEGMIDHLYVDPEWVSHGIGGQLLDLADQLRPAGLDLWTFASNVVARRFYERHGLVAVVASDGDNEEGQPDVRYRWSPRRRHAASPCPPREAFSVCRAASRLTSLARWVGPGGRSTPVDPETEVPMNESNTSTPRAVADQTQQLAEEASDRAGTVAAQAGAQAKVVVREAKDHAREVVDRARHDVQQQAEQRSGQAADGLRSFAGQVGALADGRPDEAGPLVDYLRDAGDRIGRLASRFDEGPQAVLADVRSFARRRPLAFLGLCGAVGFVAGRLARAQSASDGPAVGASSDRVDALAGTYATADPFTVGAMPATAGSRTTTLQQPYTVPAPPVSISSDELPAPIPGEVLR